MNTTYPYADDAEVKLITMANFPKIQNLLAFVGAQFRVGVWQPKVNIGIMKQWLSIEYTDGRINLNNPVGLVQFQNAIHLPYDIWLNVDMLWMSGGNDDNTKQSSSSYLYAKLYKAFLNNRFSVTVEANDIFNKSSRYATLFNSNYTSMHYNKQPYIYTHPAIHL